VDILISRQILPEAVRLLEGMDMSVGDDIPLPRWGFVSEASFLPLVSPDGMVNVDLHILPDCYPLYRGLTTELVFAEAIALETALGPISVPRDEHAFLIALGNATKEKFGPDAMKSLIDAARLMGSGSAFDWKSVRDLAGRAGLARPLEALLALIGRFDQDEAASSFSGIRMGELNRAEADLLAFFANGFPATTKLRRELFLTAEPAVTARRMMMRFGGLFTQRDGNPTSPPDKGGWGVGRSGFC
jgi:hypothetical protein